MTTCYDVFAECVNAIEGSELIVSPGETDKEFHFQNWFQHRLEKMHLSFDKPKRNSYPDFSLVRHPEGYEVKGLAWPGRDKTYDANSQMPSGIHNDRTMFYVFGRYPNSKGRKRPNQQMLNEYPVIDLIICHGDFLNIDRNYVHKNKNIKAFGSYGDIMIRDRKMYVVPHPFTLTTGTTGNKTLIVPTSFPKDERFENVGNLIRVESKELIASYNFDLRTNSMEIEKIPNLNAGEKHSFSAYRLLTQKGKPVTMASIDMENIFDDEDEEDEE